MGELSFWDSELPPSLLLGAIAAGAYLVAHARHRGLRLSLIDVLLVMTVMAVGTAVAMPLVSAADDRAKHSALLHNLRAFRGQIELYKVEHGGEPPLLYEGTFPQLTNSTDSLGIPGKPGKDYPYGPYLPGGVPANPYTGISKVIAVDAFPPTAATGIGGWLYHQETGQIAADLEEYLDQ